MLELGQTHSALSNEEMIELSQAGDERMTEQLVIKNSGLVWGIARRYVGSCELEDLYQIGCVGLVKAIKNFNSSFNVKFSTYAVPMIMGEIRRFLRDDGIIKVSRSIKETAKKAYRAREKLTAQTGREPTISELSEYLGISSEELAVALDAVLPPQSIYAPVGSSEELCLDGMLSAENEEEEILGRLCIKDVMKKLKEEERKLIHLRYFESKTQQQTAKVLGVSQVQVSRLEKKILLKMRKLIE